MRTEDSRRNLARCGKLCLVAVIWVATLEASEAAFTFVPGNYYAVPSSSRMIRQYNSAGTEVGSFSVAPALADEIRGIAFGPDGLLYTTAVRGSGFAVLAFDSSGALQQTYAMDPDYLNNLSWGKIAVDRQHIYVAGAEQLTKFDIGNPASGTAIFQTPRYTGVFDVDFLPNGNLIVAVANHLTEITPTGTLIREMDSPQFLDLRGVEYDPVSNKLFVTELGYSGFYDQLMRIDWAGGTIEDSVSYWYGDDLYVTDSGKLLVGSWVLSPGIFTQDLVQTGSFGVTGEMFLTQYPVPESSSCVMLILGGFLVWTDRRNAIPRACSTGP